MDTTQAGAIIEANDRQLKRFIRLVNEKYHFALLHKIAKRIYGDVVGETWTSRAFEAGRIPDFYIMPAMEALGSALLFWQLKGVRRKAIHVLPSRTSTGRALAFLVDLAEGVLAPDEIPSQAVVEATKLYFVD